MISVTSAQYLSNLKISTTIFQSRWYTVTTCISSGWSFLFASHSKPVLKSHYCFKDCRRLLSDVSLSPRSKYQKNFLKANSPFLSVCIKSQKRPIAQTQCCFCNSAVGVQSDADGEKVIHIQGLPKDFTKTDIINFFEGIEILNGPDGVHFISKDGEEHIDEAYIELADQNDVAKAQEKHMQYLKDSCVKVFQMNQSDVVSVNTNKAHQMDPNDDSCWVILKGLPYISTDEDIREFFSGLEIPPDGITIKLNDRGFHSGVAFVHFADEANVDLALKRHFKNMQGRYIEVFPSTGSQMRMATSSGDSAPPGDLQHCIFMRGLPYRALESDVVEFFRPMRPVKIDIPRDSYYRNFGRATVEFSSSEEAVEALKRHRKFIQHRYIELFRGAGPSTIAAKESALDNDSSFQDPANGRSPQGWEARTGDSSSVRIRGLPNDATEDDVEKFFEPLNVVKIRVMKNPLGKQTGRAIVEFPTREDANEAVKKDRAPMKDRYIEVINARAKTGWRPRLFDQHEET